MSALIETKGLTKTYWEGDTEHAVLRGVDVEVNAGETVSIVGASGAGKSTFLHIIGTIDDPTSGTIFFEGNELLRYSEEELAQFRNDRLGFVFQFHHLLPEFSALENIMMPLWLRSVSESQRRERARWALSEVGLADRETALPGELSGGEQQRIAVARAIVGSPDLLLADEPTGNLDASTGERLMDLLFDLNGKYGLTLIYVSHNERLAARAARQMQLSDGLLV